MIYIVLDNVRSVHNVGSIFRTAECLGVSHVVLSGYTPAPADRFGRWRKDFAKVSLGAEKHITWRHFQTIARALRFLREKGVYIVAVEQAPEAVDYRKVRVKRPAAFVFGNERGGLSRAVLRACDVVAEIPMRGRKESLNVSVAAGIAISRMLND